MNLIIDIGNTATKLAVFQRDKILKTQSIATSSLVLEVEDLLKKFPEIKQCILSSVGYLSAEAFEFLKIRLPMIVLESKLKLPFQLQYKTPNSLGGDRLALMAAAASQYAGKNVLVIDAGSCVTYDFIDAEKNYLGGSISPGINMRYKSLSDFTLKLPALQKKIPKAYVGNSTKSSIHSGVVNGLLYEIEGTVSTYQKKYADLTVILTGGDADFLCKQLKSSIFATSNFLLEGLNFLLELNSNQL